MVISTTPPPSITMNSSSSIDIDTLLGNMLSIGRDGQTSSPGQQQSSNIINTNLGNQLPSSGCVSPRYPKPPIPPNASPKRRPIQSSQPTPPPMVKISSKEGSPITSNIHLNNNNSCYDNDDYRSQPPPPYNSNHLNIQNYYQLCQQKQPQQQQQQQKLLHYQSNSIGSTSGSSTCSFSPETTTPNSAMSMLPIVSPMGGNSFHQGRVQNRFGNLTMVNNDTGYNSNASSLSSPQYNPISSGMNMKNQFVSNVSINNQQQQQQQKLSPPIANTTQLDGFYLSDMLDHTNHTYQTVLNNGSSGHSSPLILSGRMSNNEDANNMILMVDNSLDKTHSINQPNRSAQQQQQQQVYRRNHCSSEPNLDDVEHSESISNNGSRTSYNRISNMMIPESKRICFQTKEMESIFAQSQHDIDCLLTRLEFVHTRRQSSQSVNSVKVNNNNNDGELMHCTSNSKETLTVESRHFVTASKFFVKCATEGSFQLIDYLTECITLLERMFHASETLMFEMVTHSKISMLVDRLKEVASTYAYTVDTVRRLVSYTPDETITNANGNGSNNDDANDDDLIQSEIGVKGMTSDLSVVTGRANPYMDILMKNATNLANSLSALMRTLKSMN